MQTPPQIPHYSSPHSALFFVLSYVKLPDLLTLQRVCTSFRDTINSDTLLWRRIVVEPPLSSKITDHALLRLAEKSEGKLEVLGLYGCGRVTDDGLLGVARNNIGITKLHVPGCINITADGVVRAVKWLTDQNTKLKSVQISGISNLRKAHFEMLNTLMCTEDQQQVRKQSFYGIWQSLAAENIDERPIDVEICPKCSNIRLVFYCTRENCRTMKARWLECKGCIFCIERCEDCGGCLDSEFYGEHTACSHLLCLECWLRLPKCNLCNRPYCFGHDNKAVASSSFGFVCEQCDDDDDHDYEAATNDYS